MKTLFENTEFCRETFRAELARDQIVASMSRAHRRAKTARRLRNGSVLLALILTTAVLLHKSPSRVRHQQGQARRAEPTFIVRTQPFDGIIHTTPLAPSTIASPSDDSFAIVHTLPNNHHDITDDQLLAHFKSRAVALVKSLSGARLEFLDDTQ